jgi:hypothetical protein
MCISCASWLQCVHEHLLHVVPIISSKPKIILSNVFKHSVLTSLKKLNLYYYEKLLLLKFWTLSIILGLKKTTFVDWMRLHLQVDWGKRENLL